MFIQREAGGTLEISAGKSLQDNFLGRSSWDACLVSSQADISWSVNGVPKGIIKQSLGHVPIMVKSQLCNLHGLTPKELVEHHEEAEVRSLTTLTIYRNVLQLKKKSITLLLNLNRKWVVILSWMELRRLFVCWLCKGGTILLPCQDLSGRTGVKDTLIMVNMICAVQVLIPQFRCIAFLKGSLGFIFFKVLQCAV